MGGFWDKVTEHIKSLTWRKEIGGKDKLWGRG